ncbi:hypothetical protein PCC7418_0858 [Halothece sp. PCC 7418]|uniref:hypothetical protein n=1 Tax=Halothece sp. (strain PCC 7418) TaxID=65093 RepID=UPI0002A07175|nr:hypothetical protein [Halothece sp. PCC 7418]AFZ43073.1 hypothetical protein PCC7418_0858 [Halothece sp. PCC 7418]
MSEVFCFHPPYQIWLNLLMGVSLALAVVFSPQPAQTKPRSFSAQPTAETTKLQTNLESSSPDPINEQTVGVSPFQLLIPLSKTKVTVNPPFLRGKEGGEAGNVAPIIQNCMTSFDLDPDLGLVPSLQAIKHPLRFHPCFQIPPEALMQETKDKGQRTNDAKSPDLQAGNELNTVQQMTTVTPAADLSTWQLQGELLARGSFWGGNWQIEVDQTRLNRPQSWYLDNFQYFRPTPETDLIVGQQTPFWLEKGEYWGITYLQREGVEATAGAFPHVNPEQRLQTHVFPRDITGQAKPGTLVQLTRNQGEEVLQEVWVGKDGNYRFQDVPFGKGGLSAKYDILFFPQGQRTLNPEQQTVSFRPLAEQLPEGSVSWLISTGARRNNHRAFWGDFSQLIGGATLRWGVADSITLGVGLIHEQGWQRWGEFFFSPLDIPLDVTIAGVLGETLETRINYQPTPHLNVSFQQNHTGNHLQTHWQILPRMRLSARWDSQQGRAINLRGRFRQSANGSTVIGISLKRDRQLQWQIRQQLGNLEFSHRDRQGITQTRLSYALFKDISSQDKNRLNLAYQTRDFHQKNHLLTLSWQYQSGQRDVSGNPLWDVEIGYRMGSQGEGMKANLETTILPGLRLRGHYEILNQSSPQNRFRIELTTEMDGQQNLFEK